MGVPIKILKDVVIGSRKTRIPYVEDEKDLCDLFESTGLRQLSQISKTVNTVARRVQKSLEEPFVVDGKSILISPRVGIAAYPEHGSTANELFSHSELSVHDAEISNTASEASLARGTVV